MVRNNVDLDVTVVESDGSTNRYIVPAASVKARNLSKPNGLTVSAGQVRGMTVTTAIRWCSTYPMAGEFSLDEPACLRRGGRRLPGRGGAHRIYGYRWLERLNQYGRQQRAIWRQ